jgi:transposase-like protein
MSSPRKRYGRQFKLEVVRRVQETGRSQAQVAKELGISPNTLSRWMRQYRESEDEAFPGKGRQNAKDALIRRLRSENDRLRKERDFLKKTAKYFAAKNEPDIE